MGHRTEQRAARSEPRSNKPGAHFAPLEVHKGRSLPGHGVRSTVSRLSEGTFSGPERHCGRDLERQGAPYVRVAPTPGVWRSTASCELL